jgi:hypothetical protein
MSLSLRKYPLSLGLVLGLTALGLTVVGGATALAAPQALGLVATNGSVDLVCQSGRCGAEFTAFCLQADRFSPVRGTRYDLASTENVRLTGTLEDGRKIALDPEAWLRVEALRTHVAVAISVPSYRVAAQGLAKIELEVGEKVALLPTPQAADPRPLDQVDVALATGPLRSLGSQVVDHDQERMTAARVTNRMINLLPAGRTDGTADGTGDGTGDDGALWSRALGSQDPKLSEGAQDMAQGAYRFCRFAVERSAASSLRACLQGQHDGFLNFLNSQYWDAIDTGS